VPKPAATETPKVGAETVVQRQEKLDFTKTEDTIRRLKEIIDERKRANPESKSHIKDLSDINSQNPDVRLKIEALLHLVASLFDASNQKAVPLMSREVWINTYSHIEVLLKHLESSGEILK